MNEKTNHTAVRLIKLKWHIFLFLVRECMGQDSAFALEALCTGWGQREAACDLSSLNWLNWTGAAGTRACPEVNWRPNWSRPFWPVCAAPSLPSDRSLWRWVCVSDWGWRRWGGGGSNYRKWKSEMILKLKQCFIDRSALPAACQTQVCGVECELNLGGGGGL